MILSGDDIDEMARVKEKLAIRFEIKELRSLRYFLGYEGCPIKEGNPHFLTKIYSRSPERNWNL